MELGIILSSSSSWRSIVVGVLLYNGLVTKRNRVDEAVGQIEVQLKRRHDLIPNLVAAVKDYMGFEQEVLTRVTEARANAVAAGAQGTVTQQQVQAENALSRRPALAVRRRRELPGAEGQRERPGPPGAAHDDREPDQLLAPALQRDRQRLQHDDPDHPVGPDRRTARLHEARLLRRRARGRPGPGRRPALTLARPGAPRPPRPPWPHRSTTRPRPTGGTRSCWCWSSSPCSRCSGSRSGTGRRARSSAGSAGSASSASSPSSRRSSATTRATASSWRRRRPGRRRRPRRPSCSTSSAS